MHQSLPSLLFPEYRCRVLGLLLLRPDEALHGRWIARRTGLPAGTITRELGELGELAEVGLLKREKRGKHRCADAGPEHGGPIRHRLQSHHASCHGGAYRERLSPHILS